MFMNVDHKLDGCICQPTLSKNILCFIFLFYLSTTLKRPNSRNKFYIITLNDRLANAYYVFPFLTFPSRTLSISSISLSWTSGFIAKLYARKDKVFAVVSNPAKKKRNDCAIASTRVIPVINR